MIHKGWAIRVSSLLPHRVEDFNYVGVGWFNSPDRDLWNRRAGHNIMIWETRQEAREALKRVSLYSPRNLRVERVVVDVRPAKVEVF